jgi:hypothetical protein
VNPGESEVCDDDIDNNCDGRTDENCITCSYTITPATSSFTGCGGYGSFNVTAPDGCDWTADTTADTMIDITAGSGSGSGVVSFVVTEYAASGAIRRGTIDVEQESSHLVSQTGGCSFEVSPSALSFNSDGGTASISVTTESCCDWTSSGTPNWIGLSPGDGTGSNSVTCTVDPNETADPRSATITVAGQSIFIEQSVPDVTFVVIGDNDGYGFSPPVADGDDLTLTLFDNREDAETDAQDGSQYTDYAAAERKSFIFDINFTTVDPLYFDFATFTLDVAGLEQDSYGVSSLLLDGTDYSASLPRNQGMYGSEIIEITLDDISVFEDGTLTVNFQGGDGWDFIAFDYFILRIFTR